MRLLIVIGAILLAAAGAQGEERKLDMVVPFPAESSAGVWQSLRDAGVAAVAIRADSDCPDLAQRIRAAVEAASRQDLKLWVECHESAADASNVAGLVAPMPIEGLALVMPNPVGEPAPPGDLKAQLALMNQGRQQAEIIRQVKDRLGDLRRLVIVVDVSEIDPENAGEQFVPVKDLIRDGTVDVVCLSGAEGANFHRLRLLRQGPLRVGTALDGRAIESERMAGMVSRSVLAAVQNRTSECLWMVDVPAELACRVAADTLTGYRRAQQNAATLEQAIAAGELVLESQTRGEAATDQATVHGVAQSFVPSRDGECPLVEIFAALRGCQGPLPPDLVVEIRQDDGGRPGDTVLAKAEIPAADFGHEPAYRWASARFAQPVQIRKDCTYWIHLPDAVSPQGSYVWRMMKNGAGPRGRAWSRRHDYAAHAWMFRVYMNKEPER